MADFQLIPGYEEQHAQKSIRGIEAYEKNDERKADGQNLRYKAINGAGGGKGGF
jgi:hypothetical protein